MYEQFYGLSEKPFSILPDPEFLYWGRSHKFAFTMLEYSLANQAGITVITGEIGCGKTTLVRHFLEHQAEDVTIGLLSNTQQASKDLMSWVLMAFDQPFEEGSSVAKFEQFQKFLIHQYAANNRTVLIVDEAQNLDAGALEELRMLTNINVGKDLLLQLILLGQPQLKALLQKPEMVQFVQRITSDFNISPLERQEVGEYIHVRLEVAGRTDTLFDEAAIEEIYGFSRGIPRLINILCDTCLIYGFSANADVIDGQIVKEVLRDKEKFGVFDAASGKFAPASESQSPFEVYAEGEGPALVINDRRLARLLLSRAQGK